MGSVVWVPPKVNGFTGALSVRMSFDENVQGWASGFIYSETNQRAFYQR